MSCNERVSNIKWQNGITLSEARTQLMEKGECVCTRENDVVHSDVLQHSDTVVEDRPLPFSLSACLIIKDNNILLPEWLAYHYTVGPLRRVIVGVDPGSHTDPKPILKLYESIGMNITVWENDSFWTDGRHQYEKIDFQLTRENEEKYGYIRHLYRQNIFYEQCLQQLHDEKRTWTLLIDTDEYFAFNHYDEKEGAPTFCGSLRKGKLNKTCAKQYETSIDDGSNKRTKLSRSSAATVAEHIYKHVDDDFEMADKPCVIFSRYLFVSDKESNREEIQKGLDSDFNATLFHTFRYRYRTPFWDWYSTQNGKPMIDVSRYGGEKVWNCHRPLLNKCLG